MGLGGTPGVGFAFLPVRHSTSADNDSTDWLGAGTWFLLGMSLVGLYVLVRIILEKRRSGKTRLE